MDFKRLISSQINNTPEPQIRHKHTSQASIFEAFAAHDIGRELQAMSQWLDEHPEVLEWLHEDLSKTLPQRVYRTPVERLAAHPDTALCGIPEGSASRQHSLSK